MEFTIAKDWIIDEEELREYDCFDSEWRGTTIPDVGYYIQIEPETQYETNVSIYLVIEYANESFPIAANYTFSISSANFCENFSYTFTKDNNYHGTKFCHKLFFDPKNGFFQNGKLTLQLRGSLKYGPLSENKIVKTVGQMLWENENKDFIIEAEGKEIKADKFILRERSPYFAAMFDSGMKESRENKVKFEGFPFEIVEAAIKLCYDCKIKNIFSVDDLFLLLQFADLYDIDHAKTYAESFLIALVDESDVCRIANISIKFNAEKLRLFCKNILWDLKYYSYILYKKRTLVADFDSLDANFKAELASEAKLLGYRV